MFEGDTGRGDGQDNGRLDVGRTPITDVPSPASEQIKKHGIWCRVKNRVLSVLNRR